jgi:hypothetical protein
MKNIHIIPTDKSSRLYLDRGKLWIDNLVYGSNNQHIYITSDEKPKKGDWSMYQNKIHKCIEDIIGDEFKKIILTTDQDLIADGVQAIPDEFLEWFVKNPSCEEVKVDLVAVNEFGSEITVGGYGFDRFIYKIIIPQEEPKQKKWDTLNKELDDALEEEFGSEEPKQETLEEAAKKRYIEGVYVINGIDICDASRECFIEGAKYQAERMYSEKEVFSILDKVFHMYASSHRKDAKQWFEQFKKK